MNINIERAQILMEQSRFELAEEQLRLALAHDSSDSRAHALLALCLSNREKFDDATAEAEQAIHISPDHALGFYALSAVMHKRNRLKEAHKAIDEAIRIEPWNSSQFALLAAIEIDRSRWNDALDAADRGLEIEPEDVQCTNLRAIALVKLGRRDEAGQTIDIALAKAPENATTHANQGWALLHQREPTKAAEHFREALRLDPTMEWARRGIIEAMKARNPVYRMMLAFFLWMDRLSPKVQLALVLGLVFGNRIVYSILEAVPLLSPLATPFTIAYILFVWMCWTSSALFNLMLCLNRFGRLVLSRSEKQCAMLVGCCIATALFVGVAGSMRYRDWGFSFWPDAALFLGLAIPISAVFNSEGQRQKLMAAYTAGLLGIIVFTIYNHVQFYEILNGLDPKRKPTPELEAAILRFLDPYTYWFSNCITGIAVSTWLGLGMSIVPRRK